MKSWSTDAWKNELTRNQSVVHMTMAYVFTFFVGWFGMNAVGTGVLWLDCLAFHLFTTLGIFLCSLLYNNSSLYDPFWSILPIWLVLYGASQTGSIDPSEV